MFLPVGEYSAKNINYNPFFQNLANFGNPRIPDEQLFGPRAKGYSKIRNNLVEIAANKKRLNDFYRDNPNKRPKPDGKGHGDPHLTTFDGTNYDFQGAGEYTFVKSTTDDFEIQTRQESVNGRFATINRAVAIQSGGSKISFDNNTPNIINVDGIATDITNGGFAAGQNLIIRQGSIYFINTGNGDQIQITHNTGYIDLQVSLADNRQGKVVGLLGNFNGSTTDEFALRDGTIIGSTITNAQLYGVYNDSWRITPATSLFNYNPGETTATFTKPTEPTTVLTATTITPTQRAAAEQVAHAAGITDPQLLENAILDLFVTNNDSTFIQGYQALQKEATANAPNTLINPDSFGEESWLASGSNIPYNIRFTNNNPSGTTPLAKITITQQLDSNLDLNTFSFSDINFGNIIITVPFGRQSFTRRVDLRSTQGVFVDIDASIDPTTSTVIWNFVAIDPLTGNPADSNTKGFLPPNDTTGIGQGIVGYTLQPKLDTANDTRINSQAQISFNSLAPITTDAVFITLDNDAPTSKVATAIANGTNIDVTWAGTDASSGLAAYDVYVSTDGGEYQIWQNKTTKTSATYSGETGRTYSFYSIATDNVDRLEFKAPLAESSVSLGDIAITPISYTVTTDKSTIPEGNSGSTPLTFTIARSGTINAASSINYALTGTATNDTDYKNITGTAGTTGITGTVNFAANEANKIIALSVLGDAIVETDENILLTLSAPSTTTPASIITISTATATIQNDDVVVVVTTPKLLKNPDETFMLKDGKAVQVTLQNSLVKTVNELAAFTVDDAQGLIDGIAPGAAGYAEKAIGRARTIFSTIANNPTGFDQKLSSQILPFNTDGNLAFLYLKNNSIDNIKASGINNNLNSILFAQGNLDSLVNESGVATLNWKDTNGAVASAPPELVANAIAIADVPSDSISLTSKIIDLSKIATPAADATFNIYREASYNNTVSFYKVIDAATGGIDTNNDGIADLLPGQVGYARAAISNRIVGADLFAANGSTNTIKATFDKGIYAPVLIVDGTAQAYLSGANLQANFAYTAGNSDGKDHIRFLGAGKWGVEDLPGLGDGDFNDLIISATFTPLSAG